MGFRKTKNFNSALVAKLAWMVASKSDSLCMKVLRSKNKVGQDWLRKEPPKSVSKVWKGIENATKKKS